MLILCILYTWSFIDIIWYYEKTFRYFIMKFTVQMKFIFVTPHFSGKNVVVVDT